MANMNEESKVLTTLRKAMATCNGVNETVAMLYGANDSSAAASGFVGNGDVLCSTLLCVLNHVGEDRATPAEMAITRASLAGGTRRLPRGHHVGQDGAEKT